MFTMGKKIFWNFLDFVTKSVETILRHKNSCRCDMESILPIQIPIHSFVWH